MISQIYLRIMNIATVYLYDCDYMLCNFEQSVSFSKTVKYMLACVLKYCDGRFCLCLDFFRPAYKKVHFYNSKITF